METTDDKHWDRERNVLRSKWVPCLWQTRERSERNNKDVLIPLSLIYCWSLALGVARVNSLGDELASWKARNVWEESDGINTQHCIELQFLQAQF